MDKIFRQNTKMISLLKGLLISYIITTFLLLLLSFLMLKLDLPGMVMSGGLNFVYIVSVFIGAFFVGKKIEQRKFLWGMVMGVFYFVIVLLVSLMMNSVSPLPLGSLFTVFIICSMSGTLGGMIS